MIYELWSNGIKYDEIWHNGQEYVEAWTLVDGEKTLVWKKGGLSGTYFAYQNYIVYVNEDFTEYSILNLNTKLGSSYAPRILEVYDNDTWIISTYRGSAQYYITHDFEDFELLTSVDMPSSRLYDFSIHSYYCQNGNDYLRRYSGTSGNFIHYDASAKTITDETVVQPYRNMASRRSVDGIVDVPNYGIRLDISVEHRDETYTYTNAEGDVLTGTLHIPMASFDWNVYDKDGQIFGYNKTYDLSSSIETTSQTDTSGGISTSYWQIGGCIYAMYHACIIDYSIETVSEYGKKAVVSRNNGIHYIRVDKIDLALSYVATVYEYATGERESSSSAESSNPYKPYSYKRLVNADNESVLGDMLIAGTGGTYFWIAKDGSTQRYNGAMSDYPIKWKYVGEEEIHETNLGVIYTAIGTNYEVIYIEDGERSKKHPRLYISNDIKGIMIFENGIDFDTVYDVIKIV